MAVAAAAQSANSRSAAAASESVYLPAVPHLRSARARDYNQRADHVSVVMPVFNTVRYLGRAIDSILGQTYPHFELILVDDGSTDGSLSVARTYAALDERVRVIARPHAGVSAATNAGIEAALHPWVAIMHADDIALPRRLEKQLRAARQNPDVVAWGSFAYHISPDDAVLSFSATGPTSRRAFRQLRSEGRPVLIIHASALMRRDVVLSVGGYDPGFHTCEDLDLFDRMAEHGPILALPEPLLERRLHGESNTVRTFFDMLQLTRYVVARGHARLEGREGLDRGAFLDEARRASLTARCGRRLNDLCQFHYHEAGVRFGARRYAGATLHFGAACLLNPAYSVRRVWRQMLGFRLRTVHPRPLQHVAPKPAPSVAIPHGS